MNGYPEPRFMGYDRRPNQNGLTSGSGVISTNPIIRTAHLPTLRRSKGSSRYGRINSSTYEHHPVSKETNNNFHDSRNHGDHATVLDSGYRVNRFPIGPSVHDSRCGHGDRASVGLSVVDQSTMVFDGLHRDAITSESRLGSSTSIDGLLELDAYLPAGFGGWSLARNYEDLSMTTIDGLHGDSLQQKLQKNQHQVYLRWVNSQLKKKPNTRVINDLTTDLNDGTALADLIEVISGETLDVSPTTTVTSLNDRISNVDKVLHFMKTNRIPMHPTLAQDIVFGDVKSIMRLVLALAARYKPNSVRHTRGQNAANARNQSPLSVIGYAQSAVTALADARRNASVVIPRPKKPQSLDMSDTAIDEIESPVFSSESNATAFRPSLSMSMSSSSNHSISKSSSQDFNRRSSLNKSEVGGLAESEVRYRELFNAYRRLDAEHKDLKEEHDVLQSTCQDLRADTKILKKMLLTLRDLLRGEEEAFDSETTMTSVALDDVADVAFLERKRTTSSEEDLKKIANDVNVQIGKDKDEMESNSKLVKATDEIRYLQNDKTQLERKLTSKNETISSLRNELSMMDQELRKVQFAFQTHLNEKEQLVTSLHHQIQDLHRQLQNVNNTEASLAFKVATQEKKMMQLEDRIIDPESKSSKKNDDEFSLVRETLRSLRMRLGAGHDDGDCTQNVNELEDEITRLINRLKIYEHSNHASKNVTDGAGANLRELSTTSTTSHNATSNNQRLDANEKNGDCATTTSPVTRVVYFVGQTECPLMCSVDKRSGQITLNDIRKLFIRKKGCYRYHFRTHDSEFGFVKEEV